MPLTAKQQRFVDEYVIDLNAAAAARRAGYSERTARVIGPENLTKPAIAAAIKERIGKHAEAAGISAQDVWHEWGHIARSDIGDIIDMTGTEPKLKPACEIPESARRAIKSVKVRRYLNGPAETSREVEVVEFEFWSKPSVLSTIAKAMGELIDRVEHSGPGGGPITHEHTFDPPDVSADEFRALPPAEQLRRLKDAVQAINRN